MKATKRKHCSDPDIWDVHISGRTVFHNYDGNGLVGVFTKEGEATQFMRGINLGIDLQSLVGKGVYSVEQDPD